MGQTRASLAGYESRRDFFRQAGSGLAGIALASMLQEENRLSAAIVDPLAPKKPHHAPKAKAVIWLFMEGGPSHVDLFDPKPKLTELNGQPMPASFGKPMTAMGTANNTLMGSPRTVEAVRGERASGSRTGIRTSPNTPTIWR